MDANSCFLGTEGLRDLALYSHMIPAIATLVLGIFALLRAPDRRKASIFFSFTVAFSLWLVADMVNWVVNDYYWVAATWAPLDYINIVFFLLLLCFVYYDVFERLSSRLFMGSIGLAAVIPFFITASGNAVYEFNQPVCEMIGNDTLALYKFGLEIAALGLIVIFGAYGIVRSKERRDKIRLALTTGSIALFLGVFAGAEYISTATEVYETMLYALFVLPIFVLFLTISITHFGTLKLGDASVRVLFYIFLILAGTQFFFIGDMTEFLLAVMSFGVILVLGIMLFLTSEREMRLRIKTEKQERELEIANVQQENLLHFISHEIKGYLTEGQNAFAGIIEGDYGLAPAPLKAVAETALVRMRDGVSTVMNILDASNLKKGTVLYKKDKYDFRDVVEKSMDMMTPRAQAKNLAIDWTVDGNSTYAAVGDKEKIQEHVVRNLIDNAIRYTPKGCIHVSLTRLGNNIRFSVKDTGVGITEEDKARLFTEGGHGKDSIKVNVDSTGYGLFIAKQVTEAHGGKIWAESDGAGKGSEFIVELPTI